jgi:hypothetical protein
MERCPESGIQNWLRGEAKVRITIVFLRRHVLMIASADGGKIVMAEVTDPTEVERARAQDERFERNSAWLQSHIPEVYSRHRGKCICVSGEELFVADTPKEVLVQAKAAHPEDDGRLFRYIPRDKVARIYAY